MSSSESPSESPSESSSLSPSSSPSVSPSPVAGEAFILVGSPYIVASGENTTAQLTPPGAKTTGDFQAGRIQDDENPTDLVDLGEDKYTEIEFCIQATNEAEVGATYEFRVTKGQLWLPTDIPGCKRWGREDAIYDGSNRESQYTDKSGNGNHFIQATDAKKFLYVPNQIDGHPSHRADGIDDIMYANGLGTLLNGEDKPATIFYVYKRITIQTHRPWAWGSDVSASFFSPLLQDTIGDIRKRDDDFLQKYPATSGNFNNTNWHYMIVIINGTTVDVRLDGTNILSGGDIDVGTFTANKFAIGAAYIGGYDEVNHANIDIAEDGVYDNDISAGSIALLESYLATRYPSI